MGNGPDIYNLIAKDRGVPDGWNWFSIRGVGESRDTGGALVKGAVCTAVYKSGRYKGDTNWSKRDRSTERELFMTFAEIDARAIRWEQDTGNCSKCGGDGQEMASTGVNGTTYRNCSRCKATGRAPTP